MEEKASSDDIPMFVLFMRG